MKLHQLQALIHVVEQGSLRAASESLHLTQAALSKALSSLEDELETLLLVRHPRGVTLTPAGERLHERALLITRQVELARHDVMDESAGQRGQLRVALTPYLAMTALKPAFVWFRQRYPQVELTLQEGLVAQVLPALRNGSLDLAIVADSGDVPVKEFQTSLLQQVRQRIVLRAGHPVLSKPDALALAGLEWVLPRYRMRQRDDAFEKMFRRAQVAVPATVTRCDALIALALVQSSSCASILPEPMLQSLQPASLQSVAYDVMQPPDLRLLLLTLPNAPMSRFATHFVDCIMQGMATPPPDTASL